MNHLERFCAVMDYGEFDHPPFFEDPVWSDTLGRTHQRCASR